MTKGYRIRIYPTKTQEALMWKHISCCRYVWNYMINVQEERYKNGEKYLSAYKMINLLKPLKNDGSHEWLYEVSNTSLQVICRDVDKAYCNFFNGTFGHPKYKTKKSAKQVFPVRCETIYFLENTIHVEKIGQIKYKTDFIFPLGRNSCKFYNPRITFDLGKWFLSFGMELESQELRLTNLPMGIDLGVKEQAVVAFGEAEIVFHNINKSKKMKKLREELKRTQQSISRKYQMAKKNTGRYYKSNNIKKEEFKARCIYRKMSNIRKNYIHQITNQLVSMAPSRVVMEDLDVIGMLKNKKLARSISEQNFNEFIRQMRYKCEWNGIPFYQADRFYPSSKTCSCCGNIKKRLGLDERVYACNVCGLELDRDFNAALNLSRYAI